MATLAEAIEQLRQEVEENATADGSAIVLLNGINARIADAVADALAAGATPEQLAELSALMQSLSNSTDALGAATAANTPVA